MTLQLHGRIDGPIVMIAFGSIGRGTLPLILRHFGCDRSKIVIIDPSGKLFPEDRDEGDPWQFANVIVR